MRMLRVIAAVSACVLFAGFATPAFARVVAISGNHALGAVQSACAEVGGAYSRIDDTGAYSCIAPNSNGVICDASGVCRGFVHFVPYPQFENTLASILGAQTILMRGQL